MNTQQNQNEIKKSGVKPNPSRDVNYDDKEKDFSGEFGEQIDENASEEVNPSELDKGEVELDRGGVEFSGGDNKEKTQKPNEEQTGYKGQKGDKNAFDTAVKNAGSKGNVQGYEENTPDVGMSGDLGGDVSQYSKQKKEQGKNDQPTRH
jgi:hypothetical protein